MSATALDTLSVRPSVQAALGEARAALERLYGDRLVKVILYGSHARGEAHEESDVDVLFVLQDEFTGFLLASHVVNPGIPQTFNELLDYNVRMNLQRFEIPESKIGTTFGELSEYFNNSGNGILIGITSEREAVQISDILSADPSSLDTFIARKFEESGIDIEREKGHRVEINPPRTLMIEKNDVALLIGVKQD
ncbi:MAG: nucleotidyltransferase domain-containing protein [Bacteroidetes bacterium]|nr:nucleotidyltransferase domain-containing protein [Bacteroidota bacterium]